MAECGDQQAEERAAGAPVSPSWRASPTSTESGPTRIATANKSQCPAGTLLTATCGTLSSPLRLGALTQGTLNPDTLFVTWHF